MMNVLSETSEEARSGASPLRLLVLDSSYSLETIRLRGLEESVTCRDLDGFFDHVWTVHPFATLVTSEGWAEKYGLPQTHIVSRKHTFIEGKVGRFNSLHWCKPLNFFISQVYVLKYLFRIIRDNGVSVIRAGSPLYLGLLGLTLSRLCRTPLVVRVGGNHDAIFRTTGRPMEGRLFFFRWVEKIVEGFVLSHADLVAGANQDNLNYALANGARTEFSTLFRYGNLVAKQHFLSPSRRADGVALLRSLNLVSKKFLLYIGRLESVKHPDHVLIVASKLRTLGFDIKALLVGDGQLRSSLIALAQELGIKNDVVFAGNKDQDWLVRVLPHCAVVLSPHTGRALTEAALAAVPIVAYDIDWQGELIATGKTGELVRHLDIDGLTYSVKKFLERPCYRQAMGEAVRERCMELMDPDALNQHEREHYRLVIQRFKREHG